jgi:hypothetical protein
MSLYSGGNDSNLEVLGFKDEDQNVKNDAVITCVITKVSDGSAVATVSIPSLGALVAVTVGGVTYLNGNYRGVLSGANNPALVAGAQYQLVYSASNYGWVDTRFETAQARIG